MNAKWSVLRTLGSSRILAFSVFVPFLGFLILFNQQIVDWLLLSPLFVGRTSGNLGEATIEATREATLNRLYIAYFGLSLLGIGSFLFSIFCPGEIKELNSASEYISYEKPLVSQPRLSLLVATVAVDYWSNLINPSKLRTAPKSWSYPAEIAALFQVTFVQIAESLRVHDEETKSSVHESSNHFGIWNARAEVQLDTVVDLLVNVRRYNRAFYEEFVRSSQGYEIDLLTLRYMVLDCSRPLARALIATLYFLGFGILLYPTVTTFVQILTSLIL